jgi:uncharacterized protein YfiM (DUF2279 family)
MKLPATLSEGLLQALPPAERKRLGRAGMTRQEAATKYAAGQEKELKKDVVNEIYRRGGWLFEQPMSKRTRGRPGVPDIIACYRGLFLAVELKAAGGTMTQEQGQEAVAIRKASGRFVLAYSLADVTAALQGIDADDQ